MDSNTFPILTLLFFSPTDITLSNFSLKSSLWKTAMSPVKTSMFFRPRSLALDRMNSLCPLEFERSVILDLEYLAAKKRPREPQPQPRSRMDMPEEKEKKTRQS